MTHETCGRSSAGSLRSARLQLLLENRLRQRLAAYGSPEYVTTWKHWDMASGAPICALRASPLRMPVNACGGWPTPNARDWKGAPGANTSKAGNFGGSLPRTAKAAGWATPTGRDHKDGQYTPNVPTNALLGRQAQGLVERPGRDGPWDAAEWIECADGKYRRLESGVAPLVDGLPADMGMVCAGEAAPIRVRGTGEAPWRKGMIQGYGNAIVPQEAAEFLMAYMDIAI